MSSFSTRCQANKKLQAKFESINQQLGRSDAVWEESESWDIAGTQPEYYADDDDDAAMGPHGHDERLNVNTMSAMMDEWPSMVRGGHTPQRPQNRKF